LFLGRAANAQLKWGLRPVAWQGSASIVGTAIQFDRADYVKRYLQKNARWKPSDVDAFEQAVAALRPRLAQLDRRAFFHGHDFLEALEWYFRSRKGSWRLAGEALRDALMACIEFTDLRAERMFAEIERRLRELNP